MTQVLQQEAYPAIWPLLTPKTRPSLGLSHKMGENLSEMWPNCRAKFHADWSTPAEKSVTVHKKDKKAH